MNLHGAIHGVQAIPPQSISAATVNGADIDVTGVDEIIFFVNAGTCTGSGTMNVKIQEAPDDGAGAAGTYADVASAAFTEIVAANDVAIFKGIVKNDRGRKKWLRAVATAAVAACVVGVVAIEGEFDNTVRIGAEDFVV